MYLCFLAFLSPFNLSAQKNKEPGNSSAFETGKNVVIQNELIEALTQKFLGHYEESRILFLKFTQNHPQIAEGFFRLAEINRLTGRSSEAVQAARQAVKLDSRNKFYRQFLAETLADLNLFKEAEEEYETLCRLFPAHVDYLEELADVQIKKGKMNDAVKTLEKLEDLTHNTEKTQLRIYGLYIKTGNFKEAYRTAEKMLSREPQNARFHGLAADACKAMANENCRLFHLNEALRLDSLNPQAHMALALKALEEKDYTKSFKFLKKAYDNPELPLDEKMLSLLGLMDNASVALSHEKELHSLIEVLKGNYPNEAKVWSAEGDFYMLTENPPAAFLAYAKAIALDRSRMPVWRQVLLLSLDIGRYELTLAYADTLLELNPVAADPYMAKAMAYTRTGQLDKARKALSAVEWALEENPLAQARWNVIKAEVEMQLGHSEEALKLFQEARRLDPKSLSAMIWETRLLCRQPSVASQKAAELQQSNLSGSLLNAVAALCLARSGNTRGALDKLSDIENKNRYLSPLTLEIMGEAAEAAGHISRAQQLWQKALDLAPDHITVKDKLKKLKP